MSPSSQICRTGRCKRCPGECLGNADRLRPAPPAPAECGMLGKCACWRCRARGLPSSSDGGLWQGPSSSFHPVSPAWGLHAISLPCPFAGDRTGQIHPNLWGVVLRPTVPRPALPRMRSRTFACVLLFLPCTDSHIKCEATTTELRPSFLPSGGKGRTDGSSWGDLVRYLEGSGLPPGLWKLGSAAERAARGGAH